ncbi:FAD-dependent oxidoreductase [Glycomyces harbinensis]|uniref:Pyruvate/2-oxoglutarate dehydrogenase complex, dihydrolipoamide dehydrogenase (E3) component n=1 Tax=Glycomyces harbinensis TaxID=58114 RepID=A0A1G6U816_9ACTN|nr:FAD-dependent oxidoreductase [Glycomyces harbinensis]SDD37542.1 Pyruvate/2-oxoglutarate dehydrogenase complex, dihydrolipoamide dehydrogenase (E3) component [Glycomyces harbinensis]
MTRVLVIGAGPAGLAAAAAAADAGARVTLLDSGDGLGGQYWRHLPPQRPSRREARLHHGWKHFQHLQARVRDRVEVITEAQVWAIETAGGTTARVLIGPSDAAGRESRRLTADAVVLAPGAHDRTLPFPGWHLPGVYSAGAAQALAKGERIRVGRKVVVAGAGPFLLPVAQSLTGAGATVLGVYEAARLPAIARGWLPRPQRLLRTAHKGRELAGYAFHHLSRRVPYRLGRAVVEARGDGRVEEAVIARLDADWAPIPGTERTVAADAVCVSHGFTPRLELPIAAGCAIGPDRFVQVDADQRTSVPGVYAAGEITGIGGVDAALVEGRIAGHRAAGGDPAALAGDRRLRRATTDLARRIEAAHGIRPGWTSWLRDDTVVCRCEEVPYGRLRDTAAATGQSALRSVKLTTRAGLGICQARMCGRTVEELTGASTGDPCDTSDRRPLAAPIRLGDLAELATAPNGDSA